jgi:alkylated DNA repair dioxygenase AlkB
MKWDQFDLNPPDLMYRIFAETTWDTSMKSRLTASYGVPYDYSQMEYGQVPIPDYLNPTISAIYDEWGWRPNNCLINLYPSGESRMGFHSDDTKNLFPGTGIVIFSLGGTRTLVFREKVNASNYRHFSMMHRSIQHGS